jgi:hypothetical protein
MLIRLKVGPQPRPEDHDSLAQHGRVSDAVDDRAAFGRSNDVPRLFSDAALLTSIAARPLWFYKPLPNPTA